MTRPHTVPVHLGTPNSYRISHLSGEPIQAMVVGRIDWLPEASTTEKREMLHLVVEFLDRRIGYISSNKPGELTLDGEPVLVTIVEK